jgi:hypothetical protein
MVEKKSNKQHTPIEDAEVIMGREGKQYLLAADSASRVNQVSTAGAWQGFEPTTGNKFILYEQMGDLNPHISIPLTKLSLSLVKGIRFTSGDVDNPADEELINDFKNWSKEISFRSKLQTLTRLIVKNGTFVGKVVETKSATAEGGKVFDFQPVMMKYTTLLPKGVKPGDKPDTVMTPPIVIAYINEGDEKLEQKIKENELIYGAIFPYDKPVVDIYGRETYGIYGISVLDAVHDTFMRYLDLVKGYTEYIRKYGIGRYFYNYSSLEEILKEGDIDTVKKLIAELRDTVQYIQENEDIVGCGFDIKNLDQTGTNIDIVNFKQSLETDIQVGLLQQPLTMGRAEGTTYASGYVSEADRLIVLEGLQEMIQDFVNKEIIDKRLVALGKEPGFVKVVFEELSQPSIVFKDLLLAYEDGIIARKEIRTRAGLDGDVSDQDILEGRELLAQIAMQSMGQVQQSDESKQDKDAKGMEARKSSRLGTAIDEKTTPTAPSKNPSKSG